jgi:alginate O-acetyltransferase complex protein AlgI
MSFNSAAYALLVLVIVGGYYSLRQYRRQNYLLLAAGLYFYGSWDYRFLFLLLYSASVDYIGGLGIVHERPSRRHTALFVATMSTATFLLLAPIDWQSVLSLVLPPDAFAGGWSNPLHWRELFVSGGDWRNFLAAGAALVTLGLTTTVGYALPVARQAKYFLCVSLIANLTLLGFFKYFDFFAASAAEALNAIGFVNHELLLGIIVPAGISFYTFQAMSYSIDVYRGQLKPTHRFTDYLLFVSFFPHLVAGPIQEANWLLPQLQRPRTFDWAKVQTGVFLIGWGLFKKIFIADNLVRSVAPAFALGAHPTGPEVLFATYVFAFQIYADFSAYSDIARGTSRLLGIELTINFNLPYLATNPREFWRRWHISLSTWLRDYLYVGLGGNRNGRVYRNLLLTMVLGGLWHGARMNFVLWGLYQGALLCAHRWIEPTLDRLTPDGRYARAAVTFASWFVFFHLVCYGWLLFRAETGAQILSLTTALFTGWPDVLAHAGIAARLVWFTWPLLLMQYFQARSRNLLVALTWPWPVRTGVYVVLFYLVVIFGASDGGQFIYFQF